MTAALGAHFFHRWQGWWGTPAAFSQRYLGNEPFPGPHARPARPDVTLASAALPAQAPRTAPAMIQPAYAQTSILKPAVASDALPGDSQILDRWKDLGETAAVTLSALPSTRENMLWPDRGETVAHVALILSFGKAGPRVAHRGARATGSRQWPRQIPGDQPTNMVERIKRLLTAPAQEWPRIDAEPMTIKGIYMGWVVPLAAIGPVAGLIGSMVFGYSLLGITYRPPIGIAIGTAVIGYVMALIGVYVLSLIINALAPNFGGTKNAIAAFKVAAFTGTAGWLAGVFQVILAELVGHPWALRPLSPLGRPADPDESARRQGDHLYRRHDAGFDPGLPDLRRGGRRRGRLHCAPHVQRGGGYRHAQRIAQRAGRGSDRSRQSQ